MINLKLLLLLALISFSAQDACLQKFQICSKDIPVQTKKIDNCIDYYTDGGCYQCKLGYAVSSDQKSCKSFVVNHLLIVYNYKKVIRNVLNAILDMNLMIIKYA